jgi:hypothetical protein
LDFDRRNARPALLGLCLLALAACGVEGAPKRPEPKPESAPEPGVTISGYAEMGVAGGKLY